MDETPLPNELDVCHRMIASLQSQVQQQAHSVLELKNHNDKLELKNVDLQLRVDKLLQQLFGRRSERHTDGEGQLFLDLGDEATPEVVSALEEAVREAEQVVEDAEEEQKKRKSKPPVQNDRKFPEHLPRIERIIDVPEDRREGLKLIGYDEVETLEWIRPELRVRVNKYAKYAHPGNQNQGIASPERPTGLVQGDRFDASVGVEVVAWKYFYHLPFYRQQDLFAGSGWTPSRSTLANIETAVEFALRPLAEHLRSFLKTDTCVGCDDTGVVLITPRTMPDLSSHPRGDRISEVFAKAIESGKPSIKANFWGYYASRLPVVAFDFTVSRHRDGPDDVLGDYEGTLIGDCWSGFQKIDVRSDSRIMFAACWAHARRKIDECQRAFPIRNMEDGPVKRPKSKAEGKPGRPRTDESISDTIIRIRKETGWGYTKIVQAMRRLGHRISRQTVKNILVEAGLGPDLSDHPDTWSDFLKRHAATMWQCDFASKRKWTIKGMVDLYFLVFIHFETRRIWVSPCTANPTGEWTRQQARNFDMFLQHEGLPCEILQRDQDSKYIDSFDEVFRSTGCKIKKTPARSPNLQAFVERVIQTLKHEVLNAFCVVSEKHMDHILRVSQDWYNHRRGHSSRDHLPPVRDNEVQPTVDLESKRIVCHAELGGHLKSYHAAA